MNVEQESRPRILIVEDEPITAADLGRSLGDLGYDVLCTAGTGRMAIRLSEQTRPDLVLMDIHLQGPLDGIAAAEEIRKRWHIPVVFLTAHATEDILLRAGASGANGYLTKPFRLHELNATLLVALRQHQLTQELFSERAWLRTTLATLSDGILATDQKGYIQYLNPVAERLTGWTIAEAFGKSIDSVFPVSALRGESVVICELKRALASMHAEGPGRFWLMKKDGQKIPVEESASPIVELGRASGAVSVFMEITDRLRREREADERKDQLEEQVQLTTEALGQTRHELRALSSHLLKVQDEERSRMARELHDDFGQQTAILAMQAERALQALSEDRFKTEQLLEEMREQIDALESRLRSASHRLHPSLLSDLGLITALRSLIEDFQQNGGEVILRAPEGSLDLPLETTTALFRIAQEALRNSMKHARGAPVRVTLACDDQSCGLTVDDAGPGFNLEQAKAKGGLGLLSMQERARMAGGNLLLRTRAGEGTVISVRVPRKAAAEP